MESPRSKSTAPRLRVAVRRDDRRIDLGAVEIRETVRKVLKLEHVADAEISVAVLDDAAIHAINRNHLGHDFPTDVISFVYESARSAPPARSEPRGSGLKIEGEIVLSAETARREASRHGWSARSELQLYIVHGLLHLCGYDDLTPAEKRSMRRRERAVLKELGIR
jgi:probable rRNA maturation factor